MRFTHCGWHFYNSVGVHQMEVALKADVPIP